MVSKTPKYDAKISKILDQLEPGERTCAISGKEWELTQDDIKWLKKLKVPPSELEPLTRWAYRAAFWMGLQMWNNKDYRDGKTILTLVHPATKWKIMPDQDWFQEDFSSINLELDVSRPAFDSIEELCWQVPIQAYRHFEKPHNSISLCSLGDEDSYFVIATRGKRNYFCSDALDLEDSMETFVSGNVDRSFNVVHSYRVADSKVVRESRDCMNCNFVFDCRNCEYCFGAWNKRNKKYLWWNEQLSQEEWEKRVAEIDLGQRSVFDKNYKRFADVVDKEAIWPENFNVNSDSCTGDYLIDCVDCQHCNFGERSRNCVHGVFINDCHDMCHADGPNCSNCYLASPVVKCEGCKFSWTLAECIDCEYCINSFNCEHCFGCVGLNRKRFHIFNKEYSEDEYWTKLDELKCEMLDRGEYGKYFPMKLVQSYVPDAGGRWMFGLTQEDMEKFDYPRFGPGDAGAYGPLVERLDEARDAEELPDNIDEIDDSWIGVTLVDKERGRPFTLQKREVDYCKKYRIPISTQHPLGRLWHGSTQMNLAYEIAKKCQECQKELMVSKNMSYSNRKIYCKFCYLKYLEQYG